MTGIKGSNFKEGGTPFITGTFTKWQKINMITMAEFAERLEQNEADPQRKVIHGDGPLAEKRKSE